MSQWHIFTTGLSDKPSDKAEKVLSLTYQRRHFFTGIAYNTVS